MNAVAGGQCGAAGPGILSSGESAPPLSEAEFHRFRRYIYQLAGIHLSEGKKALVSGRLGKRVRHHGLRTFGEYFELVNRPGSDERQIMVDLLTTNETYFFREEKHFDLLKDILEEYPRGSVSAWSAACSTGEELYSMAMVLAEARGMEGFSILGTDVSSRVLELARRGIYPIERAARIPKHLLRRYCLRGVRNQEGNFSVEARLRSRTRLRHLNLHDDWDGLGRFHLIFLRNVMIYFDVETKRRLIERMANYLEPGGYLFVGHSESLNGMSDRFVTVVPSVYRLR